MSKAAIEAGARACEKYLGNRADLAAPINHEDLSAAIVIAFLRALQEGPSEEEVDHTARKMDPKAFQMVERGWPGIYDPYCEDARRFARAARIAHLAWLIAEIEGETA